jgi:hypothetical protein
MKKAKIKLVWTGLCLTAVVAAGIFGWLFSRPLVPLGFSSEQNPAPAASSGVAVLPLLDVDKPARTEIALFALG